MSGNYDRTIKADVDDLRADADEVWDPAREKLGVVRKALPVDIPRSAFSLIPGAGGVHRELVNACENLEAYLSDGEVAMRAFRDALLWAALDVIGTDASVQDDIAEIKEQLRT